MKNSVHGLLWSLKTALEDLVEGWDYNQDGVDLNELDANEFYPFDKSLDEVLNDVQNWADEVEEELEHRGANESLKKSAPNKLYETWAGEDVIDDIIERAKSNIDDGGDVDDAVTDAIDTGLIYTKDIRTLAEHYDVLPSDSELINLFYEELFGEVYSAASDYYDEVHEDGEDEDFEEGYKRVKSLIGNLQEKYDYDEDDLVAEFQEVKKIYKGKGAEGLSKIPLRTIKSKYPNFAVWFERYHKGMESNDDGNLDENSTTIEEYWEVMDEVDFDSLFDYIEHRAAQIPIKYYMKHADMYDSGLDETEVFIED